MASLILSIGGDILQEIQLAKPRTTIGRRPGNDIRLENLAVSGEHAVVVQTADGYVIEDAGSTNGTEVNGERVEKRTLKDGDVIQIGKYHLKFIAARSGLTEEDFAKTLLVRSPFAGKAIGGGELEQPTPAEPFPITFSPEMETRRKTETAAAPPAAEAHQHPALLRVLTGRQAGTEIPIDKPLVSVGKRGSQVAVVTRRPNGYFIQHLQGERHPLVNGVTINDRLCPLSHGDLIEIAGVRIEFRLR